MHYRRLGHSGLKVSEISLGAWVTFGSQIDEKTAIELIHAAYDQGVNFFDNADMYANGQAETVMGKAIRDFPREALVISSKVFWPTMPGQTGGAFAQTHHRIGPCIAETAGNGVPRPVFLPPLRPGYPGRRGGRTMNDLIRQGKILYWGTSEWSGARSCRRYGRPAVTTCIPPAMEQPQYNLFTARVEDRLSYACKEFGLGLTTFSPL